MSYGTGGGKSGECTKSQACQRITTEVTTYPRNLFRSNPPNKDSHARLVVAALRCPTRGRGALACRVSVLHLSASSGLHSGGGGTGKGKAMQQQLRRRERRAVVNARPAAPTHRTAGPSPNMSAAITL